MLRTPPPSKLLDPIHHTRGHMFLPPNTHTSNEFLASFIETWSSVNIHYTPLCGQGRPLESVGGCCHIFAQTIRSVFFILAKKAIASAPVSSSVAPLFPCDNFIIHFEYILYVAKPRIATCASWSPQLGTSRSTRKPFRRVSAMCQRAPLKVAFQMKTRVPGWLLLAEIGGGMVSSLNPCVVLSAWQQFRRLAESECSVYFMPYPSTPELWQFEPVYFSFAISDFAKGSKWSNVWGTLGSWSGSQILRIQIARFAAGLF